MVRNKDIDPKNLGKLTVDPSHPDIKNKKLDKGGKNTIKSAYIQADIIVEGLLKTYDPRDNVDL